MRVSFLAASGIPYPTLIPTATPASASYAASGTLNPINCTPLVMVDGWDLLIPNLQPNSPKYVLTISNIKNPISGNLVISPHIRCKICPLDNSACPTPMI